MKYCLGLLFTLMLMSHTALAATGRVFVTNERSGSISVIDQQSLTVTDTVNVGERPRGIGRSPDGKEIYVAVSAENKIKVLDPKTLKIIREFEGGSDPETFAVHPNGNIYISNEDDAKATVIDPKTGAILAEIKVGLEPEGVAVSPSGEHVIITSESTNMLHVINTADNTITHNILVSSRPRAATFNKRSNLAYATTEIGGEVVKADIVEGRILNTTGVDTKNFKPKDILLSKDEQRLYVAGGRANAIKVLAAADLKLIKSIPVGKRVWGLALSKDGKRLFTTNGLSSDVSVIDTSKNEVIKTIGVGSFPWGVLIDD